MSGCSDLETIPYEPVMIFELIFGGKEGHEADKENIAPQVAGFDVRTLR